MKHKEIIARNKEIVKYLRKGFNLLETGKKFDLTGTTILRIARESGLRNYPEEIIRRRAEIVEFLRNNNGDIQKTIKQLKVDWAEVYIVRKKYNIKTSSSISKEKSDAFIINQLKKGKTTAEIRTQFGFRDYTIYNAARRTGNIHLLARNIAKKKADRNKQIVKMIREGYSVKQIIRQLNLKLQRNVVVKIAHENGYAISIINKEKKIKMEAEVIKFLKKNDGDLVKAAKAFALSNYSIVMICKKNNIETIRGQKRKKRKELANRIVAELKKGTSLSDLCKQLDKSRSAVVRLAHEAGFYIREYKRLKVEKLLKKSLRVFEIAKKLNMSEELVHYYKQGRHKMYPHLGEYFH